VLWLTRAQSRLKSMATFKFKFKFKFKFELELELKVFFLSAVHVLICKQRRRCQTRSNSSGLFAGKFKKK
jgi:hypothetical protein